ncbi:MAG: hypothetical protein JNG88_17415 [Phycisphaerales bacterium]|nr:hypothetical protein [Phycisphaerales bacterium]
MIPRIATFLVPASIFSSALGAFAFDGQKATSPPTVPKTAAPQAEQTEPPEAKQTRDRRPETPFAVAKVGIIALKNADAREIAGPLKVLTKEFPADVMLSSFAEGKLLLIAAQDDVTLERMKQIATMIDEASPQAGAEGRTTTSVVLQHADATQVAQIIAALNQNRHCQFVPDTRTNTLWLAGDQAQVAAMQRVAQQLDAASAKPDAASARASREMEYYVLANTPAAEIGRTLRQLAAADPCISECEIIENSASNTCIVLGSAEAHKKVAEIIKTLDRPMAGHAPQADRTRGEDRAPAGERAPREERERTPRQR